LSSFSSGSICRGIGGSFCRVFGGPLYRGISGSVCAYSPVTANSYKNFILKDQGLNEIFSVLDNGNGAFNGSLTLTGKPSGTPLLVRSNTPSPIFRVTNAGGIYLDQLAAPPGTLLNLKVDDDGLIVAETTPYSSNTCWEVGGNTMAGGSLYELGTMSLDDLNFVAGGATAISIEGSTTSTRGRIQMVKPVGIGGNPTAGYAVPDPNWSLTLRPIATGTGQGSFRILDDNGTSSTDELFSVSNEFLNFQNGALKMWYDEMQFSVSLWAKTGVSSVDLGRYSSSNGAFRDVNYHGDLNDISDFRLKDNIKELNYGLSEILKLQPKIYTQKLDNRIEIGFIAQEVAAIIPECVNIPTTDSGLYSLKYLQIIPVLTNAIQEQQKIINVLEKKISLLTNTGNFNRNEDPNVQKEELNQAPILFQNHPNPFSDVTYIDYYLPNNTQNAFLKVFDNNGKLVKAIPISRSGFGQIELNCANLASGKYYFSLLVNTQIIDTKSMIVNSEN
jgi:hypothetical protein